MGEAKPGGRAASGLGAEEDRQGQVVALVEDRIGIAWLAGLVRGGQRRKT